MANSVYLVMEVSTGDHRKGVGRARPAVLSWEYLGHHVGASLGVLSHVLSCVSCSTATAGTLLTTCTVSGAESHPGLSQGEA